MNFGAPLWLWSLLAVPLLVATEVWLVGRDRGRLAALVARPLWGKVVSRPHPAWRWVRLVFLAVGAAGVALALARPQWGIVREKIEREGVDVVLVLDCSGSMAVEDVRPNRFFLARAALLSLVERLGGDRFALVAFEGEAYPLVPLTLDADAVGLFLETLEPGIVPAPGTSIGAGLARGLSMFVDEERDNRVMVIVSDGEDLEGEIAPVLGEAKEMGVVIHTVGVGTAQGAPVPDFDNSGNRTGFKKDGDGSVVVSRLDATTLEAVARGAGGQFVAITPADTSLWQLAAAIDTMENKTLAKEYAYRKKERYQIPLAAGLLAFTLGLLLPPPNRPLLRRRRTSSPATGGGLGAVMALLSLTAAPFVRAEQGKAIDELLLRPQRLTGAAREAYAKGDHPRALKSFEDAAALRPDDARLKFNLADGFYKSGKYEEAAAIFRALGAGDSPLAGASRYNLGNSLFQKQDYAGAVRAFRDALTLLPDDPDARRNLEVALRALEEQQKQQREQQQTGDDSEAPRQGHEQQPQQDQRDQQRSGRQEGQNQRQERPQTDEEKERERFLKETGMPKERAQQLLDALQASEKAEQQKQLAAQRAGKRTGKDW